MLKKSQGIANAVTDETAWPEISKLVSHMQDKVDDAVAQTSLSTHLLKILEILFHETPGVPRFRALLDMTVVSRTLVSTMCAHPQNTTLQINLCKCLHLISAQHPSNRACLLGENVLSALVQTMNNNVDEIGIQVAACQALSEALRDLFVQNIPSSLKKPPMNVVESIVSACMQAMRIHTTDDTLNRFALHVIFVLYRYSPGCPDLLLDNDGIGMIIRSMQAFGRNDALQLAACNLISCLVREDNKTILARLSQEDAASAVLAAMDVLMHGKNEGSRHGQEPQNGTAYITVISYEGEGVMQLCLSTLLQLYSEEPEVPHEQKGLGILPRACAKYLQNRDVQRMGTRLMEKVVEVCAENMQHIGRPGIRAAISAMVAHNGNEEVLCWAMSFLATMTTENKKWAEMIVEDGGLRVLVRNLEQCPPGEMQRLTIRTICAMATDVQMKETMIKAGCAKALSTAILAYTGMEEAAHDTGHKTDWLAFASYTLPVISDHRLPHCLRARLVKDRIVEAAVHLMSKHQDRMDVQERCCRTIQNVLGNHLENMHAAGRLVTPALACAMLTHKDALYIQKIACQMLSLIAETMTGSDARSEHQELLRECGAIKAFVQCIELYDHPDGFYLAGNPLHVFSYGCRGVHAAIRDNLENSEYCCNADSEVNGMKALMAADFHYINNPLYDSHYRHAAACMGYILVDVQDMIEAKAAGVEHGHKASSQVMEPSASNLSKVQKHACEHVQLGSHKLGEDTEPSPRAIQGHDAARAHIQQSDAGPMVNRESAVTAGCAACGKTPDDLGVGKLHRCSACTLAPRYCSAECQRACWSQHKAECKANKKK
jgi:hypothetical protein